jgi:peroxiredoxin
MILCLVSCGKKKGLVHISGEIKGLSASAIYLYGQDGTFDYIDTIAVHNGRFDTQIHVDTLSAAYLSINNAEYPIYFEKNDHIKIKGDALRLYTLKVTGNDYNDDFEAFKKELKKKGQLEQFDFSSGNMSAEAIRSIAEDFIAKHDNSLVSLYLLDKVFVHQMNPDYPHIKTVINNLSKPLKNTLQVALLTDFINRWEKSRMGAIAPNFSLPDERGFMMSRSSGELRDKYVLLAFWASWSNNKMQSISEMKQLYSTFRGNPKFALVGVSVDTDKGQWKQAIRQDSLQGMQLCDLNGFNSAIIGQYAVTTLPSYFLIAPDGVILARDMQGDVLKRQISAALK